MKSFRLLPFASVLLVTNACVSPAPELMDNGPDTMEARDSGATDHPDSMGIEVTNPDVPTGDSTLVDAANDDRPTFDSIPVDMPTLDAPNSADVPGLDGPNRVDIPNAVDVANPIADTGVCPVPSVACPMAGCVDLQTNTAHCGACGALCPAVANGTAQCTAGACSAMCNAGFALLGGQCVVAGGFPRPIAPMSLGNVSLRRPTLRWALPPGADGALVELCRDRACTMIIETLRVLGSSARPTNVLPANGVVFWRLRATVGLATSVTFSPTWLFHVPAVDNSGLIETSANPHLDVNGDGFDDVVVAAQHAAPGGRMSAGALSIYHGNAMGISAAPTRVLEGSSANDLFGRSVASAGDVNGDGFGDLLVGSPPADPGGRLQAGTASVYHGSAMGIIGGAARVLEGVAAGDYFGISVATAGDVNGDGYGDVVVGDAQADVRGRLNVGTSSVYHGSATGISMVATRVLEGVAAGDHFGHSVASAGDINGDGFSDLVVGAYGASVGFRMGAGTASVYYGGVMGIAMAASRVLEGVGTGDSFGHSVASAGDLNGDGFGDLVVGASYADLGARVNAGTASVYYGTAMGISMAVGRVLEGGAASDLFGYSVASAGDVNADGFGDLVVGAHLADPGGRMDSGTASVYHGSAMGIAMAPRQLLVGLAAGDYLGYSVAGAGDINRDGFADLLVGAPFADPGGRIGAGVARVFHGTPGGIPLAPTLFLLGLAAGDFFGCSVASVERRPLGFVL